MEEKSGEEKCELRGYSREAEIKGEKVGVENGRGDVGKVKRVKKGERTDTWDSRSWLGAQASSLALRSGQEPHTHTLRAPTAPLTCATALIYGIFDLHSFPSPPIYS